MDKNTGRHYLRIYLILTLLTTLSASFIWGVNTLFLLDAGLSNTQAFAANAFFTVGMVLFEIPTGVIADTWGRRISFLLGAVTLLLSTLFYLSLWYIKGDFYLWAISSMIIGLGFTFFSGAIEAWIVDALNHTGYKGSIDSVFAKGQIVNGAAMLIGSVAGGVVAQMTDLGTPFILRSIMLGLTLIFAFFFMKDLGFTPRKVDRPLKEMNLVLQASLEHGWYKPQIKWVMCAAPFSMGVSIFAFYAMQPYLLELYGDPQAYSIAGLAAAVIAAAQIAGGILVPRILKLFRKRTTIMVLGVIVSALALLLIGLTSHFFLAVVFLIFWAVFFAASMPVRQAYLNGLIPSEQRATVLSFDSLMGSSGGVVTQPLLGKAADMYSYSSAYVISAAIQLMAVPFILRAQKEKSSADVIE